MDEEGVHARRGSASAVAHDLITLAMTLAGGLGFSLVAMALGGGYLLSTRSRVRIALGALQFTMFDYPGVPAACPMTISFT